ncbi:MAG: hypothetical protein V1929_03100 [bacterium]
MKRLLFSVAAVLLGALVATGLAEVILRAQNRASASASRLDPGLFRHDPALGWRLSPYWKGAHRHRDYTASYAIDGRGYRRNPNADAPPTGQVCIVLGDSFTFGFGVSDDDTFVQRLNASPTLVRCVNMAVPGYSTDQEVLLLEQETKDYDVVSVLLVVYLGNDLIDNERPFPIQVPDAKPYFALTASGLELRNSPVPREKKPAMEPAFDLIEAVGAPPALLRMGRFAATRPAAEWLLGRSDLTRRLSQACGPSLDLFKTLAHRANNDCAARDARLYLVLLPGRSFVEKPYSLTGRYQEFIRGELVRRGRDAGINVIDLATPLRGRKGLYYPNDGHLTREGHRTVAGILFAQP